MKQSVEDRSGIMHTTTMSGDGMRREKIGTTVGSRIYTNLEIGNKNGLNFEIRSVKKVKESSRILECGIAILLR